MFRESNIPGKGRVQGRIFNSERLEDNLQIRIETGPTPVYSYKEICPYSQM
jgi:hypothetical protein